MKRQTNKNINHMKTLMKSMFSMVEKAEARKKEKEEAEKLDMEIQARVSAHEKAYYEKL